MRFFIDDGVDQNISTVDEYDDNVWHCAAGRRTGTLNEIMMNGNHSGNSYGSLDIGRSGAISSTGVRFAMEASS